MKKLETNSAGRMPLWQSDIKFIQDGFKEAIEAIVAELGLSKSYFAISGCSPYKPATNTLAMPAGWFWWGGEILPVRALPTTNVTSFTNPVVKLTRTTYYDPNGAKDFIHADLTTENVANVWRDDYLTPTVVERSAAYNSGIRLGVGAWTLRDIIKYNHAEAESGWIDTSSEDVQFKRIGRLVVLRGIVYDNDIITGLPTPIQNDTYLSTPSGYLHINNGSGTWRGEQEDRISGLIYVAATQYEIRDTNTINDNEQQTPEPPIS